MVVMHVWFIGLKGHSGEIAGINKVRPLFLLFGFFLLCRNSRVPFWGSILWLLWVRRAWHPGPTPVLQRVGVEVFSVGGWLTLGVSSEFSGTVLVVLHFGIFGWGGLSTLGHPPCPVRLVSSSLMLGVGSLMAILLLEVEVDFLAVAEHRLIPARVRSQWSRLRKRFSSIWAPASQDSSHVGNAGVGVVSMRGAPLALPTFATAQFESFFDCGRAVRCLLPLGAGRFMHLFVLYGYQGAGANAEQLALTEQLFDAAFGELSVVARGQPCLLVGDFNVEPTKISCLAKGISAGLWVDLGEAWALAAGLQPAPTCKRSWTAAGAHRRDFMVGCPLAAAAAVLSCRVQPDRWIAPHLAVGTLFDCCRWASRVTQPVSRTPSPLACLLVACC